MPKAYWGYIIMIAFIPDNLKSDVLAMIERFSFIDGEIEDVPFSDIVTENCEFEATITKDSIVCLYIGEDNFPKTTLNYLLVLCDEWDKTEINQAQNYAKSSTEIDFLLGMLDYHTTMLLENLEKTSTPIINCNDEGLFFWKTEVKTENGIYSVCLFSGFCLYHLKVQESGNYDKYLPAYSEDDYFIRVSCESNIDISIADSLAVALVFELQATHNILLDFSTGRPDPDYYHDVEELSKHRYDIFPILYGRGIKNVLELYNTAKNTYNLDFKILSYTKVIEYIAPTIAKSELNDTILLKLKLPQALNPTAEYVDELSRIYEKYQDATSKDSELIKLAVSKVVTIPDIWENTPKYLRPKKRETVDSLLDNEADEMIEHICKAISDTRNEIAHAKANYQKKGNECPHREKPLFAYMLDTIAVQCIRWFALQPCEKRMI